jgi:ubiquinone/menaquinone biosynthesis C-methylase UbiE
MMMKELLGGKLYMAPIGDNPQKIIDLGTGFGDWAIEGTSSWSRQGRAGRHGQRLTDTHTSRRTVP